MLPIYYTRHNLLIGLYDSCSFKNSFPTCFYWQDPNFAAVPFTTGLLSIWSQCGSPDTTLTDKIIKNEHLTLSSLCLIHLNLKITCVAFPVHIALKLQRLVDKTDPREYSKSRLIFLLLQKKPLISLNRVFCN